MLEHAFSSYATMHIKLKRSLRWSGAEPLCERNGCHTRPHGHTIPIPTAFALPVCPSFAPFGGGSFCFPL